MPNSIRWIPNEEIRQHAEAFLSQHWDDTLPVDVEYIAEFRLGISILPLPGLRSSIEGDGFITRDFQEIHLDFAQHAVRLRFTVAHELGHLVLHKNFIETLPSTPDSQAWKTLYASLPGSRRSLPCEYGALFLPAAAPAGPGRNSEAGSGVCGTPVPEPIPRNPSRRANRHRLIHWDIHRHEIRIE